MHHLRSSAKLLAATTLIILLINPSFPRAKDGLVSAANQQSFIVRPSAAQQPFAKSFSLTSFLPVMLKSQTWLNTQDRETVRQFYHTEYLSSEGVLSQWTGDHGRCDPGSTAPEFKTAVLLRINYFRTMSGIPTVIGFKDEYNQKAQAAALMMSVNSRLDHAPDSSWDCFSADGRQGAGSSNLFLGIFGPAAISGYVRDGGGGNTFVGHRRWILFPQTQFLGTGDIPRRSDYSSANALWVFDHDHMANERPATRDPFIAWPPPGWVPRQVLYPRWSFAYPGADFSNTAVTLTQNGLPVKVKLQPIVIGFGENTLVWELEQPVPAGEVSYTVNVDNVLVDSSARNFSYEVKVFDAE